MVVTSGPLAAVHRGVIIATAARHKLPTVYVSRFTALDGGLVSYGPDFPEQYRLAAGYVDRILKGEKPGDLPVQAPTKYELVINLKAAKALGLRCRRRCLPALTRSSNDPARVHQASRRTRPVSAEGDKMSPLAPFLRLARGQSTSA